MNRCRYGEVAHNGPYITCPYCQLKIHPGEFTGLQQYYCIRDGGACFTTHPFGNSTNGRNIEEIVQENKIYSE